MRVTPDLLDAIERLAAAELRSTNAQVEMLLREALARRGVKVAPGKTLSQYIKDAFQEELLMAQAYDVKGAPIQGRIEELSFSSVSPAYWQITMAVQSPADKGYKVSVKYPFDTSFTAMGACKNVADAFGPAVQELLKQVVTNPQFPKLSGK